MTGKNWMYLAIEFVSIFVAVFLAFALNNWNDNRKSNTAEAKILLEIYNGLGDDLADMEDNMGGHRTGIRSCAFWLEALKNKEVNPDSLQLYYYILTRDFVSIQNTSGYQTLKSRGFELISNDSLRTQIISLYENDYQILRKLEENYIENQLHESYFAELNRMIAPNLKFDSVAQITDLVTPIQLTKEEESLFKSYIWKIRTNRYVMLSFYGGVVEKIKSLRSALNLQLED